MDDLAQEYAVYESQREELEAAHTGEYVLIKGNEVVGTYNSLDDALRVAVKRFRQRPLPHRGNRLACARVGIPHIL